MFDKKLKRPLAIEMAMDRAIRDLNNQPIGSPDYVKAMETVFKLHRLIEEDKSSTVSKDTLAVVIGNLLGILLIIMHEDVNVITSRALGLLLKPRV